MKKKTSKIIYEIISKKLNKKYSSKFYNYNLIITNKLIFNEECLLSLNLKEFLIFNNSNEFLHRFYLNKEINERLKKILIFYEKYSKIFPNYIILPENKFLYKNIRKKQKMIDAVNKEKNTNNNNKNTHSFLFNNNENNNNNNNIVFTNSIKLDIKKFCSENNNLNNNNSFNNNNEDSLFNNNNNNNSKSIINTESNIVCDITNNSIENVIKILNNNEITANDIKNEIFYEKINKNNKINNNNNNIEIKKNNNNNNNINYIINNFKPNNNIINCEYLKAFKSKKSLRKFSINNSNSTNIVSNNSNNNINNNNNNNNKNKIKNININQNIFFPKGLTTIININNNIIQLNNNQNNSKL